MPKTVDIEQIYQRADFSPSTINEEERTIEVQYTTGARVFIPRMFAESFYQELDTEPGSVRLDRLKAGAPVLNQHNSYDLKDVIGVVVDADETHAKIKFSNREEVDPIWNDVKEGILRNISVGFIVHKYVDVTPDEEETPILRAVDWEPLEISLVAIPADAGAQVRSGETLHPCVVESNRSVEKTGGHEMPKEETQEKTDVKAAVSTPEPTERATDVDTKAIAEAAAQEASERAIATERERCSEIQRLVRKAKLGEDVADDLIKRGISKEKAQAEILDLWEADEPGKDVRRATITVGKDGRELFKTDCERALLNRFNPDKYEIEGDNNLRNLSVAEMAKRSLELAGEHTDGMTKQEIASRAFAHSTSDFPLLLANVAGKSLRDAYVEEPATFTAWAKSTTISDLKQISRLALSEAPNLDQVVEGGEYTDGSLIENREQYKLLKYGKILSITEESVINDDLSAFTRIPALMGAAARRKEGDIVYGILSDNAALSDGTALFHANHANLTDAKLTVDGFGTARGFMRKQKGPAGLANLNLAPTHLLVGPDTEYAAEKIISPIEPRIYSDVNPVLRNRPQLVVESRIAGDLYYLASNQIDTVEYAYLAGQTTPTIETQQGFEVDGMKIKVKHFFAAKALDFRGLVKSTNDAS